MLVDRLVESRSALWVITHVMGMGAGREIRISHLLCMICSYGSAVMVAVRVKGDGNLRYLAGVLTMLPTVPVTQWGVCMRRLWLCVASAKVSGERRVMGQKDAVRGSGCSWMGAVRWCS